MLYTFGIIKRILFTRAYLNQTERNQITLKLIPEKLIHPKNDFPKPAVIFTMTILIALGWILIISPVTAAEPHFSGTPTIFKNSDRSITATFNEGALGKKVANITLSSDATADIQCVNPCDNSPPPKKVEFDQVQNQSVNIKPEDGKIKERLSLGPPTFPSVSDICPNGNWSTKVLSLTYENPSLHIEQKNSDILNFNFGNVTQ